MSAREDVDRQPRSSNRATTTFQQIHANITSALRGKDDVLFLAVACFCAQGHLLIEDRPGTGKTSLARAIAASIDGSVKRVQFTPDLLPSDILGVNVFDPRSAEFSFRRGPVFANVMVADEINRASPKTQSALLEVMEERRVTVDGVGHPVPSPFMVVATQNPLDFEGTYSLPEVQLDRFAMRISLGYNDLHTETAVLSSRSLTDPVADLRPVVNRAEFLGVLQQTRAVSVRHELIEYVSRIVVETRRHPDLRLAVSTRGSLVLLAVARALAIGRGRTFVTPDDVRTVLHPVLVHRMALTPEAELDGIEPGAILDEIVSGIEVPRARRVKLRPEARGAGPERSTDRSDGDGNSDESG